MPPEEDNTQLAIRPEADTTSAVSISRPRAPSTYRAPAKRNHRRVPRGRSTRNLAYASATMTAKAAPGTTQKKEMAPPGTKPVAWCSRRSSSAPIVSCIVATSSRDKYKKTTERTPQCEPYRSPRRLLAKATTARRAEQSMSSIVLNHVGMLLSSPTSKSLSGRRSAPCPHSYRANLAARPARVMSSTATSRARTSTLVLIVSSTMSLHLDPSSRIPNSIALAPPRAHYRETVLSFPTRRSAFGPGFSGSGSTLILSTAVVEQHGGT